MSSAAVAAHEPPPGTGRFGMWVFLASEVLFFGGVFAAYAYGRSHWADGFAAASRETHVVIGTANTAILLTSSACVALASACAELGRKRHWIPRLLAAAAALGLAFLALKGVEYHAEWSEHLVPGATFRLAGHRGAELFFWLYFVATGLHALHLSIGVGVLAALAWGTQGRRHWASAASVDAAGLYCQFVDVVWICLYPLIYLAGRSP